MSNFIKTLSSSSKNTTNSASGNTAQSLGNTNSQLTFGDQCRDGRSVQCGGGLGGFSKTWPAQPTRDFSLRSRRSDRPPHPLASLAWLKSSPGPHGLEGLKTLEPVGAPGSFFLRYRRFSRMSRHPLLRGSQHARPARIAGPQASDPVRESFLDSPEHREVLGAVLDLAAAGDAGGKLGTFLIRPVEL